MNKIHSESKHFNYLPFLAGLILFIQTLVTPYVSDAAIAFRSAASASSPGAVAITTAIGSYVERTTCGNVTPSIPAGNVGDLLIAQVVAREESATISMAGWNTLFSQSPAQNYQAVLFWRSATGGDPNTINQTGTCNHLMARITRFGNVDTVQPLETQPLPAANWNYSMAGNVDTGTQTTTVANSMLVMTTFVRDNRTVAQPGSFTQLYDIADATARDAGFSLHVRNEPTTGSKGPFNNMDLSGNGNDPNHGVLFAVRPRPYTLTVAVPAGTVLDDVMIASIAYRPCSNASGGACTTTITPPAGWTLIRGTDTTTGGGTGGFGSRLLVYSRVATAAEPANYTWSFAGTPVYSGATGGILSFSGVDTTSPVVAEAGQATANGFNHAAPSINTGAVTNTMLVSSHSTNSSGTWLPPVGMTESVDISSLPPTNALGIMLEMNYELRAVAGATGARTASASNPPASDTGGTHMLALRPAPQVNHFSISHDGNAINCQAEAITISAHNSAHAVVTGYTGTITLSTDMSHGDWTMITGNPANLTNTGNGNATYTFDGSESGIVVLGLKDTFVETLNINVTDGTATETSGTALAAEDNNLAFAASGFNFLADTVMDSIGMQISDKPSNVAPGVQVLELEAIRTSDDTGACEAALVGNNVIELGFECEDPTTCTASQVMINATNIAGNNNGGPLAYSNVTLDFGNNTDTTATFTLRYPDAGQISLHARYNIPLDDGVPTPSGNFMLGASNNFVVRPFAILLTAAGNPGATLPGGAVYTQAGADFTANVTAVRWQAADDTDNDGIADGHDDNNPANNADLTDNLATLNYGQETATEDIDLSATLFLPALGNDPGLTGTTTVTAFVNGAGNTAAARYDEVGIMEIGAAIDDGDYLGIGAAATANIVGRSGHVGRFTPDHFNVTINPDPPTFANACVAGVYSYLGQNFNYALNPDITITAINGAAVPATTQNYDCGGFWKLPDPLNLAYTYTDGAGAGPTLSPAGGNVSPAAGDTTNCTGTVQVTLTNNFTYSRPSFAAPVAPFAASVNLAIVQAQLTDSDTICYDTGTGCQGFTRNGITGTTLRHGKLQVFNNYGPETENITTSPFEAQYYDGANWVVNAGDSCTTVADFCPTARINTVLPAPLVAGTGTMTVTTTGTSGEVLVVCPSQATSPAWLSDLANCASAPDATCGRITFGIYRGNDRIINWQEIVR